MAEFIHESVVCCSACTISSVRKFTFAISSPDEFLVALANNRNGIHYNECVIRVHSMCIDDPLCSRHIAIIYQSYCMGLFPLRYILHHYTHALPLALLLHVFFSLVCTGGSVNSFERCVVEQIYRLFATDVAEKSEIAKWRH